MISVFEPGSAVFRTLSNGLRLAAVQKPEAQSVYLTALVDAGASSDPSGRRGLAHFLEHMVCGHWRDFLGLMPPRLEKAFHAQQLVFDAETQLDYTIYKTSFPVELLAEFAAFDVQRWSGRLIEPEAMTRSLPGILHELEALAPSRPAGRLYRAVYGMVYGAHPYGAYTFGESAHLKALSFEECAGFFGARYRADALVLVCVSPLPPDALADVLESHYGALGGRAASGPKGEAPRTAQAGRYEALTPGAAAESQLLAAVPLPPLFADSRRAAVMHALNEYVVRSLRRRGGDWHGFLPAMRLGGLWELLGRSRDRACGDLSKELLQELDALSKRRAASDEIAELIAALPRLLDRSWREPFNLSQTLGLFELLGPGWRGALALREAARDLRWAELREFLAAHVRRENVFMAGVESAPGLRRADTKNI